MTEDKTKKDNSNTVLISEEMKLVASMCGDEFRHEQMNPRIN